MWEAITTFIPSTLGIAMRFIQGFAGSYWLSLLLFALFIKIILFPLALKQQQSSAKMAAFQPVLADIQKTYANDKQKQQEEFMRLQQEHGYSPLSGCLPLLIQMPILFGLIDVVYQPLSYIINASNETITAGMELIGLNSADRTAETTLIGNIQQNPEQFAGVFSADEISRIIALDLNFFGINLATIPSFSDFDIIWLVPIISCLTMVLSMTITTKMSGTQLQGSMKAMPYISSLMFLYFGFTMPAGVTFYWIGSNLFGLVQSLITRRIYNPEQLKEKFRQEIEEKNKNRKKKNKVVKIETENGETVEKVVSQNELEKLNLQKAREAMAQKYDD